MLKAVCYAYPSSPRAARFKRSARGCYFVTEKRREDQVEPSQIHGPFDTRNEAQAFADRLPGEWSHFTLGARA